MSIPSYLANIINGYILKFLMPMYFHKKCRLPFHAFSAPCYTSHTGLTAFQRSQAGSIRRKTGLTRDRFCYKYSTQLHCTGWRTSTWRTSWSRTTLLSYLRHHGLGQGDPDSHGKCRLILFCGAQRQEQLQVLHSNIFQKLQWIRSVSNVIQLKWITEFL